MPPKAEKKEDVVESLGPKKNEGEHVLSPLPAVPCDFAAAHLANGALTSESTLPSVFLDLARGKGGLELEYNTFN